MRLPLAFCLTVVALVATAACEQLVFSQRVEVPFSGVPAIRSGDAVRMNDAVIGRVVAVGADREPVTVLVQVKPRVLPARAAFLTTTDGSGRTCLVVYGMPPASHPSRGPYWGVRSQAELATQIGGEKVNNAWSGIWDRVLRGLGARTSEPPQ